MARPRLSDKNRWLKGNVSAARDRSKLRASKIEGRRPRMPKTLSPVARAHWKLVVDLLSARRTLTPADVFAIEILCESYARWRACLADILEHGPMIEEPTKDGTIKRVQNPAAKMAAQLEVSMRMMLRELSATPLSREKVKPAAQDPKTIPHKTGTVGWYKEQIADAPPQKSEIPVGFEVSESECDFNTD